MKTITWDPGFSQLKKFHAPFIGFMLVNKLGYVPKIGHPMRQTHADLNTKKVHIMLFLKIGMSQDTFVFHYKGPMFDDLGPETLVESSARIAGSAAVLFKCALRIAKVKRGHLIQHVLVPLQFVETKCRIEETSCGNGFNLQTPRSKEVMYVYTYQSSHIYRYLDEDALLSETCLRPLFNPHVSRARDETGAKRCEEKRKTGKGRIR